MTTYAPTQATAEVIAKWQAEGKTSLQQLLDSMTQVEEKEAA